MRCRIHRLGFLGGLGAAALGLSGCVAVPTLPDQGPPPELIAQEVPQANKRQVHVVFLGGIDPVAAHEFKALFAATRQSGYTRSYHAEFWTGFDCGWVRQELLHQLEANQGQPQSVVIVSQEVLEEFKFNSLRTYQEIRKTVAIAQNTIQSIGIFYQMIQLTK